MPGLRGMHRAAESLDGEQSEGERNRHGLIALQCVLLQAKGRIFTAAEPRLASEFDRRNRGAFQAGLPERADLAEALLLRETQ